MRIVSTTGVEAFNIDGDDYTLDEAGAFEVSEEVGLAMLAFPGWKLEYEAADDAAAAQAVADVDPAVLNERVAELEKRLAELEAENAALKAAKSTPPAKAAPAKRARKAAPKKATS